ncbi:hypothetical protein YC2023_099931 [Brassica napus]
MAREGLQRMRYGIGQPTGPPCPARRQTRSGPGQDGRTQLTSLSTMIVFA